MTKLATRPTTTQALSQRYTVAWIDPSGATQSRTGLITKHVEIIGRLLVSHPAITDIEVLDENGNDCTFDFAFACR